MRFIRTVIRTLIAWTFFAFALGAIVPLALKNPQHALHDLGVFVFWIFGLYILSVLFRAFVGALRAGHEKGETVAPNEVSGQAVTAVTVLVGSQPGQVVAAVSEVQPSAVAFPSASYEIPAQTGDIVEASPAEFQPVDSAFDGEDIPGAHGARMALSDIVEPDRPGVLAIEYLGVLKAYITRESWEQVGDFADLSPDDPEYRLVALMAVYGQNVMLGFETEYSEKEAIAYALGELVRPREILERDIPNPQATAESCGVPVEVLRPEYLRALRDVLDRRAAAEAVAREQAEH